MAQVNNSRDFTPPPKTDNRIKWSKEELDLLQAFIDNPLPSGIVDWKVISRAWKDHGYPDRTWKALQMKASYLGV
jgi:hypothetical protein